MLSQLPAEVKLLLTLVYQDATGEPVMSQRCWPWAQSGAKPY